MSAAVVLAAGLLCHHMLVQEREPEFVFSYAENQTEDYPTTLGAKEFAKLVEKRSNGRIQILVQAEGALGTESDVMHRYSMVGSILREYPFRSWQNIFQN